VVILGGRNREAESLPPGPENAQDEPLWLYTDTETDLYRAGVFAGIIARAEEEQGSHPEGNLDFGDPRSPAAPPGIALYYEESNTREITAFNRGLQVFWPGNQLLSPNLEEKNLACAVLLRNIRFNSEGEGPRTLILFTWMDPVLAPRRTLAVFDDSPWAQIGPAMEYIKQGAIAREETGGLIPSEITVLRGDKTLKNQLNQIKKQKSLRYSAESADN
jgi:hypothetical protein